MQKPKITIESHDADAFVKMSVDGVALELRREQHAWAIEHRNIPTDEQMWAIEDWLDEIIDAIDAYFANIG
jgi:hypothetical protein